MPRRSVLTVIERAELLALPIDDLERAQHFTFSDSDLAIIHQRRGEGNRVDFAAQLCWLRSLSVLFILFRELAPTWTHRHLSTPRVSCQRRLPAPPRIAGL